MATNNAVNISSAGLVRYDGTGTFTGVTVTDHALLVGAASNGITSLGVATTGKILQGVTASDPAFSTATYPSVATGTGTFLQADGTNWVPTTATFPGTATSTGTILRANGTNWVATTATYPTTTTANQLLYSSATNTISEITTANSSLLKTNGSGVPSMTTTGSVTETSGAFNWPLQPCFRATLSADALNVTGNNTAYTIAANTEAYDQASNYDNTTFTFTAPVTGKYHFDSTIFMYGIVAASSVDVTLRNSGGTIIAQLCRTTGLAVSTASNYCGSWSATIPMTAADTCKLVLVVNGEGADIIDIQSGTAFTSFSGYLVA